MQCRPYETDIHSVNQSSGAVDSGISVEVSTTLYAADGNVTSMTDPLDRTTSYVYDGADRETQEIDAEVYNVATSKRARWAS